MSTVYPGTIDSFTNPSGTTPLSSDHSSQHDNANDAIRAIEQTIGTTAGTSVLKNIGAGQFAAKNNNDTFGTPTIIGGTINAAVLGTPAITGGTYTAPTVTGGTWTNGVLAGTPSVPGTLALNEWTSAGQPRVILRTTGTQSIPNNSAAAITWETEVVNVGTLHTAGSSTRLTCNETGIYLIGASVEFIANATGQRYALITKNGIANEYAGQGQDASAANITTCTVSALISAVATDYFEIGAYQNSGGTQALGTTRTTAWMMKLA